MRLPAMASHEASAGAGSLSFTDSATSDNMEWGRMSVRYDASSGDVHAQVRQSCFVHVLQGGCLRFMAEPFASIRTSWAIRFRKAIRRFRLNS